MDRQIRKLGIALLVLFLIAFAQVNYIQVFAADRIAEDPANAQRQLIAEYKVDRGSILAADGTTVLASSRKSPGALRFQRRYPHGELYAHETGFYSFVFGRTELEQSFNDFLTGDAAELLPQTLTDLILGRPKQGATIVTTLVPEIQEAAAAAALAEAGDVAIAAIDPATGDVLALVSEPTYDPNPLASQDPKVVRDSWDELNADPEKPLLSRASDELFPPGSTFKLVTASAALENGFGPESLWPNPNELDLPLTDATIENFGGSTCSGGSQITLADALRQSCNVVFGAVGLELGAEKLAEQARAYGFTAEAGEDLVPFDIPWTSGVFPAPETFEGRDPAVAISAIGQQDVAANPLQMALVARGDRERRRRDAAAPGHRGPRPERTRDRGVPAAGVLAAVVARERRGPHADDGRRRGGRDRHGGPDPRCHRGGQDRHRPARRGGGPARVVRVLRARGGSSDRRRGYRPRRR